MFRRLVVAAALALLGPFAAAENPVVSLKVGDRCPSVSAKTDKGEVLEIAQYRGNRQVILYFYPADMTHLCTNQARHFQSQLEQFKAADTVVIGISGDMARNHRVFRKQNQLSFPLVADPKGKIAEAFGVPIRKGGKIVRRINGVSQTFSRGVTAGRWTFVVGIDGTIIHKDMNVDAEKDSSNVLNVVRQLTVATE